MSSFEYKAFTETGSSVAGMLVADNAEDARAQLRRMHLFPESVRPAGLLKRTILERLPGSRNRAEGHVSLFTRQFSVLLLSGVPAVDALRVLANQSEHKGFSRALQEAADLAGSGRPLAESLGKFPQFFDRAYIGMVASGEKSGTMDAVFARLADFLERRRSVQSHLSTALIYPCLLVVMAVALLVFLSVVVIPAIKPLLLERNRPLPLTTQMLFVISGLAHDWWWVLPLAVFAGALGIGAMRRAQRPWLDAMFFRVPILGRLWMKSLIARFAASFGTLLRTGVPAVDALETLEGVISNAALAAEIRQVRLEVIEGKEISRSLQSGRLFPPMVGYMVSVGERSGTLADVLDHIAKAYESEVEIMSRRLLAALEPTLVLVMATVVGFIALSLMVTVLELSHF